MRRPHPISCCFAGLLLACLAPALVAADFTRREWHLAHGAPSEEITQIVQVASGHLWLGTTGGLTRFDG